MSKKREPRLPKVWEALIPIVFMMVIIILSTVKWGMDPHMPIVASCIVASLVAVRCGYTWADIAAGAFDGIRRTVEALLIIMCVGMLIGSWVWAGTMPAMVYYGLDLISPGAFLVVGTILTAIVGLATGSSWTASGTVGVALMGIAMGLGINPALAAGMVISGAYTGDKLSPLSDSTNVAAAGAETPLYDHVSAMMTTTVPSFCIALVLYGIVGAVVIDESGYDASLALDIQNAIADNFYLSPWIMLPVLVVIFGAIKRIPAIPSLLLAAAFGCAVAMIAQGATFPEVFAGLQTGFSIETGNEVADSLLNRGGIDSMMWTISLIMFALFFGGVLEKCGFVEVLLGKLIKRVKTVGGLVLCTIVTGIICDVVLTDQYLAILVPGRMYTKAFDEKGLSRSFLSRTTEDGATLWSPMIPWNGCGAYQSATLGVSNWAFMPYAFMNLINPILAITISYLGIGIKYKEYDGKSRAEIKELKLKRKAEKGKKIDMKKIKAYDDRAMKKSTRVVAVVAGIGLIVFQFTFEVNYSALIGLILLLTVIFQKETYATEEGISMEYDFIVYKHVIFWSYDDITDIHIEYVKDTGYQVLHYLRDVMSRRLVFRRDEIEEVLAMALNKNSHIHVDDVD